MSTEHLTVSESKEVLKKGGRVHIEGHRNQSEIILNG